MGEMCLNLAKFVIEHPSHFNLLFQHLVVQLGRSEGTDVEMGRVVVLPSFSSLLPFYELVTCERT